jgi:hypothetical protein
VAFVVCYYFSFKIFQFSIFSYAKGYKSLWEKPEFLLQRKRSVRMGTLHGGFSAHLVDTVTTLALMTHPGKFLVKHCCVFVRRSKIGTPVDCCPSRPLGGQRIRIRKTGAWKLFIETYFTSAFLAIFKTCNFSNFHEGLDPATLNLDPDLLKRVLQHWFRKLQVMA